MLLRRRRGQGSLAQRQNRTSANIRRAGDGAGHGVPRLGVPGDTRGSEHPAPQHSGDGDGVLHTQGGFPPKMHPVHTPRLSHRLRPRCHQAGGDQDPATAQGRACGQPHAVPMHKGVPKSISQPPDTRLGCTGAVPSHCPHPGEPGERGRVRLCPAPPNSCKVTARSSRGAARPRPPPAEDAPANPPSPAAPSLAFNEPAALPH